MPDNEIQPAVQPESLAKYDYAEYTGRGCEETTSADYLIPFLNIVQSMSPILIPGKPEHNPNARPGMLYNSATMELYSGQEGIEILPCATQHVFCEFIPRNKGGGFRGIHMPDEEAVVKAIAASEKFGKYYLPDGNELVETFYMFALQIKDDVVVTPIVLAFSSSKIREYRRIRTVLKCYAASHAEPPLFANRLRVTTISIADSKGTYFVYQLQPARGTVHDSLVAPTTDTGKRLLAAGAEFRDQIGRGKMRPDHGRNDDEVPF